ncbi:MAG: 50S ribosomal protein L5 [Parcubacteria group bacterium]|nr:50S ribosomal protein L5 [Parcubacteria group bacterium]
MQSYNLAKTYKETAIAAMKEKFGYGNPFAVPKLKKIIVNSGVGRLSQQSNFSDKLLPEVEKEFASIVGQKPALQKARKSIAGFKLRAGTVVGLKATLRGKRMYDFLARLIYVALPRVRDFRGIDLKNVDRTGNLTIGIREHAVFPEINLETSNVNFGMEITLVTDAKSREEAIYLYRQFGLPLKR